jgi:GNAT superfamily N-acetyltransferase
MVTHGSPPMTSVTVVQPADRDRAIATMTLAFATDPVVRWFLRDADAYVSYWPRIVEAFAGAAFDYGSAYAVDGYAGVALWFPPGVSNDDEALSGLIDESAADSARPDLDGFFGQMADLHPSFEHWYLPLTGVDPSAQGRGLGSTLLRHALERCDRDGLPAYLEATSARSGDLYLRHGFEEIGVVQYGGSPTMWRMLRQPT